MTRLGMDSITFDPKSKVRISYELWIAPETMCSRRGMTGAFSYPTTKRLQEGIVYWRRFGYVPVRTFKQTIIEENI
jgi:hypothetical protein